MSVDDPRPLPPIEPEAGDCCGSGCVRCVFDLHEDAMQRYREILGAWESRQTASDDDQRNV